MIDCVGALPVWMWVVYALAVARLTGLVALDEITRPIREALVSRLDATRRTHRSLAYLLGGYTGEEEGDGPDGCPWCLSIWVAAATAPVAWWWGDHPAAAVPMIALAVSQLAGMTASIGRG